MVCAALLAHVRCVAADPGDFWAPNPNDPVLSDQALKLMGEAAQEGQRKHLVIGLQNFFIKQESPTGGAPQVRVFKNHVQTQAVRLTIETGFPVLDFRYWPNHYRPNENYLRKLFRGAEVVHVDVTGMKFKKPIEGIFYNATESELYYALQESLQPGGPELRFHAHNRELHAAEVRDVLQEAHPHFREWGLSSERVVGADSAPVETPRHPATESRMPRSRTNRRGAVSLDLLTLGMTSAKPSNGFRRRTNISSSVIRGHVGNGLSSFVGGYLGAMAERQGYGNEAFLIGVGGDLTGAYLAQGLKGASASLGGIVVGLATASAAKRLGANDMQAEHLSRMSGVGIALATGTLPMYLVGMAAGDAATILESYQTARSYGMSSSEFFDVFVDEYPRYFWELMPGG